MSKSTALWLSGRNAAWVSVSALAYAACAGVVGCSGDDNNSSNTPADAGSTLDSTTTRPPGDAAGADTATVADGSSTPAPDGSGPSPADGGAGVTDGGSPDGTIGTGGDASATDAGPQDSAVFGDGGDSAIVGQFAGADPLTGLAGTAARPDLTDPQAADFTILEYLARAGDLTVGLVTDNWNPTAGLGDVTAFTPTFTVSPGGTYPTVQSAINAAAGSTTRVYILVTPGTYPEVDCVPTTAPPITLYSTNPDPTQTVIVADNYNGEVKEAGVAANPCSANTAATTFGTSGSATFAAFANGFQAKNITFSNNVSVAVLATTSGTQAVALSTRADQVVLENVRVLGHQDTLLVDTPNGQTVARAYIKNSTITGDVDYVFGGATFVLDGCTLEFVSDRRATGTTLSPSTDSRNPYGILMANGSFTADSTAIVSAVALGRAWDRNCTTAAAYPGTCTPAGTFPNGQALVENSTLGTPINLATPWEAAATTNRPFSSTSVACSDGGPCPANRLYEYHDTP